MFTSDWSGLDSSVPATLLRYAWRVLLPAFSHDDQKARVFSLNLTKLFEVNFVNTLYSMESHDVRAVHAFAQGAF